MPSGARKQHPGVFHPRSNPEQVSISVETELAMLFAHLLLSLNLIAAPFEETGVP